MRKWIVSAMLACFAEPGLAREACLEYEPQVVQLVGVMTRRTFAGPPNYESVKRGDTPETCWLLELDQPVCVDSKAADDLNVPERQLRSIQIVILDHAEVRSATLRSMRGRKVRVTGTLVHSHTGHHHTKVLIEQRRSIHTADEGLPGQRRPIRSPAAPPRPPAPAPRSPGTPR